MDLKCVMFSLVLWVTVLLYTTVAIMQQEAGVCNTKLGFFFPTSKKEKAKIHYGKYEYE